MVMPEKFWVVSLLNAHKWAVKFNGKPPKIYDLNIKGDFSHAEDICQGIILLMKNSIF